MVAPNGSDRGSGTPPDPWRTVQALAARIKPGDVGCLRRGTYPGGLRFRRAGTPGRPVTIRSYPGEAARIVGRVWMPRTADDLILRDLYLDGRNSSRLPSPTVNADRVSFVRVDITNWGTGICLSLGNRRYGTARDTRITQSRIHDCGRLPATNHDHGVYLARARSARIFGNWIYDNADRGIQLYPDAQGTIVRGNVIARNGQGVIFSGNEEVASSENQVERNVIVDSRLRHNVESFYPVGAALGEDNVVHRNCVYGGARDDGDGGVQLPAKGFLPLANLRIAPAFADADGDDFRVVTGPCAALLGKWYKAVPGPMRTAPALPRALR
jgi:nitrous oxidase accessory protein NosD